VQWCTSVVPATQAEIGVLKSKFSPGKSMRPYLKSILEAEGLSMAQVVEGNVPMGRRELVHGFLHVEVFNCKAFQVNSSTRRTALCSREGLRNPGM
jgi:hypothetical protein